LLLTFETLEYGCVVDDIPTFGKEVLSPSIDLSLDFFVGSGTSTLDRVKVSSSFFFFLTI
jgi:hypothetical protein